MVTIELQNEQSNLYYDLKDNDEDFTISDIIKMLRYFADCLEKGNIIYDGNYIYTKSFKKDNKK